VWPQIFVLFLRSLSLFHARDGNYVFRKTEVKKLRSLASNYNLTTEYIRRMLSTDKTGLFV